MSIFKTKAGKAVLAAVVTGLMMAVVAPSAAHADPPSFPQRSYQAAGSDTIEQLLEGYTQGYTSVCGGRGPFSTILGSWNTSGSTTITPKSAGASFFRPSGSGEGLRALSASWNALSASYTVLRDLNADGVQETYTTSLQQGGQHEIDVARSSSRPATSTVPGGANDRLLYYPVARDAVSAAFQQGLLPGIINDLSTAALSFLYNAGSTGTFTSFGFTISAGSGSTDPVYTNTVTSQVVTLHPMLPETTSGTRSFFLNAIGVTNIGSWVQQGVEENDGSVLATAGDIVPFSAAAWIAQVNGNDNAFFGGTPTVKLLSIDSKSPTTGIAPNLLPNTGGSGLFGDSAVAPTSPTLGSGIYMRDVYLVIPSSVYDSAGANFDPTLVTIVQNLRDQFYICGGMRFVVEDYGFARLRYGTPSTGVIRGPFTN